MFVFLVVLAVVFLIIAFLVRPKKEEITIPYMCGEEFPVETGGIYYLSERTQGKVTNVANIAGSILLFALLIVPLALEVMGWT